MGKSVLDSPFVTRIKHWTGFDRAIAFTVLGRFWSAFVSLITIFLIARLLTPGEQGYYYTFFSLVALQIVFELGFSFVILQLVAHERTHLTFSAEGRIGGDAVAHSRIASVLQKSVRWYSVAASLMAIALLPIGIHFFNTHGHAGVVTSWRAPWILLVVCAALTFQIDPIFSFLEGCGFVARVARMRLFQNMLGAVLSWTAMLSHHGLFSPAMMIMGQAVVGMIFLFTNPHRQMLSDLLQHRITEHFVEWRTEIWPFQWRIALSWFCGYFIFQLFTPVLFAYWGPVPAGKMGMSLTVSSGLGSVAVAWMTTKSSPFGNLIAQGRFTELDSMFFATLRQSSILLLGAAATFFLILLIAGPHFPHLMVRLLPPKSLSLLLMTTLMNHIVFCEAIYLRAHKREPFLLVTIVSSVLLTASTLLTGRFLGANAVVFGYFAITALYGLPHATYIFVTKRRQWHPATDHSEKNLSGAIL